MTSAGVYSLCRTSSSPIDDSLSLFSFVERYSARTPDAADRDAVLREFWWHYAAPNCPVHRSMTALYAARMELGRYGELSQHWAPPPNCLGLVSSFCLMGTVGSTHAPSRWAVPVSFLGQGVRSRFAVGRGLLGLGLPTRSVGVACVVSCVRASVVKHLTANDHTASRL